jgi:hypothetical protein
LTSLFTTDITNGLWLDAWVVESGTAANVQSYAGSLQFDPAKSTQSKAYGQVRAHPPAVANFKGLGTDIIQAVLGVELQGTATWSFGTVSWQNIIIVAHTTSTGWCAS